MNGFQAAFENYVAKTAAFRTLADKGQVQVAGAVVGTGPGDHAYDQLKAAAQAWDDYKATVARAAAKSSRSAYDSSKTLIIALLIAAVAIAAAVALLFSRRLGAGIGQISRAARAISRGDVDQHVEVRSRDELGQMAGDFSEMVEYLKSTASVAEAIAEGDLSHEPQPLSDQDVLGKALATMTENLRRLVGEINEASGVLNESTGQMAETSLETGRAVDEVASAINQVASGNERQVHSIAEARRVADEVAGAAGSGAAIAQDTAEAASRARELAEGGAQAATRATEAMNSVRESSAALTSAITLLGTKSDQIGGIVLTIAEEVRKLAEESRSAAGTIATLIGEIQSETAATVAVVEDGAQRTEDGVHVVDEAREAFLALGASVTEMSDRVEQIAGVVAEIAENAQAVHTSMADAASVAEESSAATEQVSASSQETSAAAQSIAVSASRLAETATELNQLVGRFRLRAG
jgi:methyl-accepting chemotaxis protein